MTFDDLGLAQPILRAVREEGYEVPTPIQQQAIPAVLAGGDLLAGAQTGTGKTAGFTLPLLQRLSSSPAAKDARGRTAIRALILTPTRELAAQVEESVRTYGKHLPQISSMVMFGGVGMGPQIDKLRRGVDILVATPGRLLDHHQQGTLDLSRVEFFVLDEADRMLDMGFEEPIREITGKTPKDRQSLLFSATFTDAIRDIARNTLRDPLEVTVDAPQEQAVIEQRFVRVEPERKQTALAGLLAQRGVESCVVFCNMRKDVDEVAGSLQHFGFSALALHGDMEQRDRDEVLVRFANRSCNVLVASDVAARGLDIEDLALVVNYDMPSDADTYVHRIGRTGRAGREGMAISLCTPRELPRAAVIEERLGAPLLWDRNVPAAPKANTAPPATMTTLRIDAGKTDKLRPGDVLGALTGEASLSASAIGKINVFATRTYVAVARDKAGAALARLNAGRIKGRSFRVRKL